MNLLPEDIHSKLVQIASEYSIPQEVLQSFVLYILDKSKRSKKTNSKSKVTKAKPLSLSQLKAAIYEHFNVSETKALKESGEFNLAMNDAKNLHLGTKESWEEIYRKTIGILPNEVGETGYGCINGINIFRYDLPWQIFGLNPVNSDISDVRDAYTHLAKIYHPDNSETGDKQIFERLTIFYKSLTETA